MTRNVIKTAIYQALILSPDLIAYFAANYPGDPIEEHVYEHGQDISGKVILYPAIRYRYIREEFVKRCSDCMPSRRVTFEILMESRKDNMIESDELMELVRPIFANGCGAEFAALTASDAYKTSIGIPLSDDSFTLSIGDLTETFNQQIREEDSSFTGAQTLGALETTGKSTLSFLRFEMLLA